MPKKQHDSEEKTRDQIDQERRVAIGRGLHYRVLLAYHFDRCMARVGELRRLLTVWQEEPTLPEASPQAVTADMITGAQAELESTMKLAEAIFKVLESPARSSLPRSRQLQKFAARRYADARFPTGRNIHDAVELLVAHLRARNNETDDAVAQRTMPEDELIPCLRGMLLGWPDELMSPASIGWLKPAGEKNRSKKKGKYVKAAATRIGEVLGTGFSQATVENIYYDEKRLLRRVNVGGDCGSGSVPSPTNPTFQPAPTDLHRFLLEHLVPSLATTLAVVAPPSMSTDH